mmetsp:Transcript_19982/g.46894  ORF Transcript_19982/g.46894 Transcript_19982/m.46894 type:complete len:621 (+) Transcript_19982:18-1880(+)
MLHSRENDPIYWFWIRAVCVVLYLAVAARRLWKLHRSGAVHDFLRSRVKAFAAIWKARETPSLSAVQPTEEAFSESPTSSAATFTMGLLSPERQLETFQADIAYYTLIQAIGPYCLLTVAMSLVRNFLTSDDVTDMSILYGDSNVLTVLVIASVWLFGYRPSRPARLLIWLFLAAWYTYCLIDDLVMSEWFLYEDIWLNHMIFVTMISMALCLPVGIIWTMTVAHTCLFLALESANGWEQGQPSAGMQVFIVAVLAISTKHSRFLLNITNRKAEAEFKLKIAELAASKNEATAAEALEVAQTQAERAAAAEAETRAAKAENEAHEATVQAKLADQAKLAAECRAQLVESMRGALQNLLGMLCDAVFEIDGDLRLLEPGKLGMVLFHSDKNDLQGRAFQDLLVEEDVVRFKQYMRSEGVSKHPLQVTFVGSYSTKISAVIYLTEIEHHDCSSKTYLVGLTEVQEQEVCARRSACHTYTLEMLQMSTDSVSIFSMNRPSLHDVKDEGNSVDGHASIRQSDAFSTDIPPEILPMEKEEQLQSLLAFLWTWPVPEGPGCCDTHKVLIVAQELIRELLAVSCQAAPTCLVWQCPGCKLRGLPSDRRYFDQAQVVCGRCSCWDMLF